MLHTSIFGKIEGPQEQGHWGVRVSGMSGALEQGGVWDVWGVGALGC